MNLLHTKKLLNKEYRLKFKPWISTGILNLVNQRDRLLKKFTKEQDPINPYSAAVSLN